MTPAAPNGFVSVHALPAGFPAYCILFKSGMPREPEVRLASLLKGWGDQLGANAFVASWDIGDKSYVDQVRNLGLTRTPAIVLSDKDVTERGQNLMDALVIRLDDPQLLSDENKLEEILPLLVNRILRGEGKAAVQKAVRAQRRGHLSRILRRLGSALKDVKLSVGFGGASIEVDL